MTTPKRGWSGHKPQSNMDREKAGLNPHIRARNPYTPVALDETLEGNPEASMRFKDIKRLIEKARREHPERPFIYHTWLYHYEDYSLSDVAEMMGVCRSTAKTRIDSTLTFLREYIHELEQ